MTNVTAKEISRDLIETHRDYGWRAEKEALFSPRRIDVLAIAPNGTEVIAFEIKTSLQDFRNELKHPDKRWRVVRNCTQFYFVTPIDLVHPSEIPEECGLLYYRDGLFYTVKPLEGRSTLLCRLEQMRIDDAEQEDARIQAQTDKDRMMQEFYERCEDEHSTPLDDEIPAWMLPPEPSPPVLFDFNIFDAAANIACAVIPHFLFNEVPF